MSIEVGTGGVSAAGGDACALAEQLRRHRSRWDADTRDGESACGLGVAARAYRIMQDAWFAEVGAHVTVLEQICQALRESAVTYEQTDTGDAARFGAGGEHGQ